MKLSPSPSELNLPADARARAARSWPARPGSSFPVAPSLITLLSIPTVPRKYTAAFSTHCVHNYQGMSTVKHTYILLYLSNYSVGCTLGQISIIERHLPNIPSLNQSRHNLNCPRFDTKSKPFFCPRDSVLFCILQNIQI